MFNKQENILRRMHEVLSEHPLSMTGLAADIGIAFYTLKSFMDGEKMRLKALSKIENWVKKSEKEMLNKKSQDL